MVHNIRVKGCSNVCDLSNKCTFKTFIPERLPWLSVVLISVGLAVVTRIKVNYDKCWIVHLTAIV